MKNNKWWIKFKNGNTRLVILAIVSYSAGLHLLIDPKNVNELIIRGVGLVWTMEAISYTLDLYLTYLKKRKEALSHKAKVSSITNEAFQLLKEDLDDMPLTEDEIEMVYHKIEKHQNKLLKQ